MRSKKGLLVRKDSEYEKLFFQKMFKIPYIYIYIYMCVCVCVCVCVKYWKEKKKRCIHLYMTTV